MENPNLNGGDIAYPQKHQKKSLYN